MIYIPRAHSLLYGFAHTLHDAMFIPDKEDKDRISVFIASLVPSSMKKLSAWYLACLQLFLAEAPVIPRGVSTASKKTHSSLNCS